MVARTLGRLLAAITPRSDDYFILFNELAACTVRGAKLLAKISLEQRTAGVAVWQTSLHNPGFARYAANCGALGIRVTRVQELDGALERALAHDGPALVEVMTDPESV